MSLVTFPRQVSPDANGQPRVGATWGFYEPNSSTLITLYTTADLDVELENPVTSLGGGLFPAIHVNASDHPTTKQIVLDADGLTVWSEDEVPTESTTLRLELADGDAGLVGSTAIRYEQTAAEYAASVTPTNYSFPPGDVRRYGAVGDGVTDDTAAIQRALDVIESLGGTVTFPRGSFKVTSTLRFGSSCSIRGVGADSLIQATVNGPIIESKGSTTSRRFRFSMYNMGIDGTNKTTYPLSVGLSLRNANRCNVGNVHISNVGNGVTIFGDAGLASYYNTLTHVEVSDADIGFYTSSNGNEAQLIGCRTNFCTEGLRIEDNSGITAVGCAFEAFGTTGVAIKIQTLAYHAVIIAPRIENPGAFSGTGTGISIASGCVENMILWPYFVTVGTNYTDASTSTAWWANDGLYFNSGTRITQHKHVTVTRDVASLAAGAFRQEGPITVTGVQVGDAVAVALPAAWPNNIMAGVPIVTATNTLYLPMYNPSGGAVDPASGDFQFTWDHH